MAGNPAARPTIETDISLKHLEAELVRIDVLIHREIRRWQLAGQDPTDAFRGQYVSDAEANALVKRPFGTSWGQTATLKSEDKRAYATALERAESLVQSVVETAQQQRQTLRLVHLANTFGLDRFDLDTLLICLAPTIDLRYERLYGYLQDDVTRKRPSVNLVLDLLCEPGTRRLKVLSRFADDAPLFRYRILERESEPGPGKSPQLRQTLWVDEGIVAWFLGSYHPPTDLGTHATLLWPEESGVDKLLADPLEARQDLAMLASRTDREPPIVIFYGPDGASQQAAARWLAAQAERPLLTVNLATIAKTDTSLSHVLRLAVRDAHLTSAILCLVGWDACLTEDGAPPPDLLAELCAHPDLAIVTGHAFWQPQKIDRERRLIWLEFPIPAYAPAARVVEALPRPRGIGRDAGNDDPGRPVLPDHWPDS
jgi:hypothetical protein